MASDYRGAFGRFYEHFSLEPVISPQWSLCASLTRAAATICAQYTVWILNELHVNLSVLLCHRAHIHLRLRQWRNTVVRGGGPAVPLDIRLHCILD